MQDRKTRWLIDTPSSDVKIASLSFQETTESDNHNSKDFATGCKNIKKAS